MKVLAVTCFTGDKKLCYMTERMVTRLRECLEIPGVTYRVSVVNQGGELQNSCGTIAEYYKHLKLNRSFAYGMNEAVDQVPKAHFRPDYVLCINNDIEMPDKDWMRLLLKEAARSHITVPATDNTSLHPYSKKSEDPAFMADEMSAYAWLVPYGWCDWMRKAHGFWLFSEDFYPAFGEDNWSTIILRQQYGDKIFRVVPKAWVKHLRSQTASQVPHDRHKTSAVLKRKIEDMLSGRGKISPELKKKMLWYTKVLRC